jgi:hypothetical protein
VGYARVSTEQQDPTVQRDGPARARLRRRSHLRFDHGLTGTNRDRPGLRWRWPPAGPPTHLWRPSWTGSPVPCPTPVTSWTSSRSATSSSVSAALSMIRPDPVGRLLFNVLAVVAEFESDLIRLGTREGMTVAKAKGRLRGRQPKLKPNQAKHLLELHNSGNYTKAELAELFGVGRSTIYRTIDRMRPKPVDPERPFAPNGHASGHQHRNRQLKSQPANRCDQPPTQPPHAIRARAPTLSRCLFVMYRLLAKRRTYATATLHQLRAPRHQAVSQAERYVTHAVNGDRSTFAESVAQPGTV